MEEKIKNKIKELEIEFERKVQSYKEIDREECLQIAFAIKVLRELMLEDE